MKRLTKDNDTQYDFIGKYDTNVDEFANNKELRNNVMNKLGQLEDIEEELGCPLDLYAKMCIFGTELFSTPHIDFVQYKHKYIYVIEDKCFCLMIGGSLTPMYYVKDYGKTWALRKEVLK